MKSPAGLWSAVRRSCQDSNQFPVLGHAEYRGGGGSRFSVRLALLLFLSEELVPHHSGQISETVAVYYTPANTRGAKFRPGKWKVKTEIIPAFDSPPGLLFK